MENNTGANDCTDLIEKDKRYLRILNEETNKSISIYGWSLSKETIKNFSSTKLSAQCRYLMELLKESNGNRIIAEMVSEEIKKACTWLESENEKLTATIADLNDRLESEKQITEQAAKDLTEAKSTIENSFEYLELKRFTWAKDFFKTATPISSLYKLRTEIDEIESDLVNGTRRPEEYADAIMCLFDSSGRAGISLEEIAKAFKAKLEVNMSSDWVDNGDGTYSRIKK